MQKESDFKGERGKVEEIKWGKERRKKERLHKKKEKDNLAKRKVEEKAKKIADKMKSSLPKNSRKGIRVHKSTNLPSPQLADEPGI